MMYKHEEFPRYVRTAGKVTILTATVGLFVFFMTWMFDFGAAELSKVQAQDSATTTLTVLNTPPEFTLNAYEVTDSSTSTPTNSGDVMQWAAIGTDSNSAPYFLLICSNNASPTANAALDSFSLGTEPPECDGSAIQWGVSAATVSGAVATVSTTTEEGGQFAEKQEWYAWVCDDDPTSPRCNNYSVTGPTSTVASSSPWHMNYRPQLINFYNDGGVDPLATLTFYSTSSDPDVVDDDVNDDFIYILVCSTNSNYSSSTNTCTTELGSSTIGVYSNASTSITIPAPMQDQGYAAYAYIFDEHGHTATGSPFYAPYVVNNVPPYVAGGDIDLYGDAGIGSNLVLSVEGGETPSSTIDFKVTDNNSCEKAGGGDEIVSFGLSVFRSSIGTTTCDGSGTNYDPNNCYDSGVSSAVWDLQCTATTTCSGPSQDNIEYTCTFPLWFVADPTDAGSVLFSADNWSAGVYGVDDDFATGTMATTSNAKELNGYAAIDIAAADIAYGQLEPGSDTGTLIATSTLINVGNTGLDQDIEGESMCNTFSLSSLCKGSATSTIDANNQWFGTSTAFSYGVAPALQLSSTTVQEIETNAFKSTSTSSPVQKDTYWGIGVPSGITYAGSYTGLNTFYAVASEDLWN